MPVTACLEEAQFGFSLTTRTPGFQNYTPQGRKALAPFAIPTRHGKGGLNEDGDDTVGTWEIRDTLRGSSGYYWPFQASERIPISTDKS